MTKSKLHDIHTMAPSMYGNYWILVLVEVFSVLNICIDYENCTMNWIHWNFLRFDSPFNVVKFTTSKSNNIHAMAPLNSNHLISYFIVFGRFEWCKYLSKGNVTMSSINSNYLQLMAWFDFMKLRGDCMTFMQWLLHGTVVVFNFTIFIGCFKSEL